MQIVDLLVPARVVADAQIPGKKRLLERLAALLDERGQPDQERAILEALTKREKLGSTGLTRGVAIPHGRSAAVDRAVGAFVRLSSPIDFGALDGQPVDLVFALVVPEHFTDQHLMFLAELAEIFSDAPFMQELRDAPDADAIYRLLLRRHERSAAA